MWAPEARSVELALEEAAGQRFLTLEREPPGTWVAEVPEARAGTRYRYRLNGAGCFPDPYSRSQPEGVHGPSEVVDPSAFTWHDADWRGLAICGQVIYQCHVGTATPDGTFDSLIGQLDRIKALGATAVQTLPLAEVPGRWNWGYDGVDLFAVTRNYGGPEALRRFVDAAHQRGLGVLVDAVYNHFGPDGNYLRSYSARYFTDRYETPWGDAVNYDGPNNVWVRRMVLDNALSWIHEYHADGLRLDATHAIFDTSQPHILAELTDTVRQSLPEGRSVVLIAETNENDVRYLLPTREGGYGLDAVWADDFHHTLRRRLAGDHEGYYRDYAGSLDELAHVVERGWLYEGQVSHVSGHSRGTPTGDRPAWQFQWVIQNHDQVGNRAFGSRLTEDVAPDQYRLASALLLLLPYTPLLFMGQEFAASTPFLYFTDHNPDLGRLVTEGRRKEFAGFEAFSDPSRAQEILDPQAEETFRRSRLDLSETTRSPGTEVTRLYQALLRLRSSDPVLAAQDRSCLRARALGPDLLAIQWQCQGEERLLLANFGDSPAPRQTPDGQAASNDAWRVVLSTDDASFGGEGRDSTHVPPRTVLFMVSRQGD